MYARKLARQQEGINRTDPNDERTKLNVTSFKCLMYSQGWRLAEIIEKIPFP